jgi:opacity protein-like surface antigen
MKSRHGLAALALVFNSARASGQTIQSQFGVASGLTVPTGAYHSGDLGGFKPGWQAMGLVTFRPDALPVSVRVDVTYGVNDADDQFKTIYQTSTGQPVDARSKLLGVNVDLMYPLPAPGHLHPYVLGGLGTYHATISMTEGTPGQLSSADTSESTVAWNLGAGIKIGGSVTALFIETRYVHVAGGLGYSCPLRTSCPRQSGPPTTFVPITAGIRFGG